MVLNSNTSDNGGLLRHSSKPSSPNLKITAVGDGMVGKTCMLITYQSKQFPEEYVPTVFDNWGVKLEVDGVTHEITLWDTAGQEDYERLRPLSYPNTKCFLLCYSISSKSSFDNIVQKWYPELKHHCPKVPILLIATKCDLRGTDQDYITPKMGRKMRNRIKAYKYMECSAQNNQGLDEIIEMAVRCATRKHSHKKCCIFF